MDGIESVPTRSSERRESIVGIATVCGLGDPSSASPVGSRILTSPLSTGGGGGKAAGA
jgi:hypothetical protein